MTVNLDSPIFRTDSYKYSHYKQYPKGSKYVTSYIEARGFDSEIFDKEPEVVFFGLRYAIEKVLHTPISVEDVNFAKTVIEKHGEPFNYEGFMRIVEKHSGYFPVKITALPEGSVVKPGIPLIQITNTDPELPWVTSFVETALLRAIWYPTTVATLSREIKKVITHYLKLTGDVSGLPFKLHDFGARGASSDASAEIGGLAHLVNFLGTDTFEAHLAAWKFGYAKPGEVLGYSIPASEHSTITSWGQDSEINAFDNMLEQFGSGLVACVSDSYDIYNACENLWGTQLHDKIREMDGILVVRPDSGDPVEMTLKVVKMLGAKFGYNVNDKGYKVLPSYIRMIQGDGVNLQSIREILENFALHGWSADNIAFGMGGGLLQAVTRDTLKFAMKANHIKGVDFDRDVYKDPVTDHGKVSKKGVQAVIMDESGNLLALPERNLRNQDLNLLKQYEPATFHEICERADYQ